MSILHTCFTTGTIPNRVIAIDTETTGIDASSRIISIGAFEILNGKIVNNIFNHLLNPHVKISAYATKIHGITNKMLYNKLTFDLIADKLLAYIGDSPILAHNAVFDLNMINKELILSGRKKISNEVICTNVAGASIFKMGWFSLDALCYRFNIDTIMRKQNHDALIDAYLVAQVFIYFCPRYNKLKEQVKYESIINRSEWWIGKSISNPEYLQSFISSKKQIIEKISKVGWDINDIYNNEKRYDFALYIYKLIMKDINFIKDKAILNNDYFISESTKIKTNIV